MVDELVQYIYENVKYMSKFVKENFPKAKMVEPEGTYLVWLISLVMVLVMKNWNI